MRLVQRRVGRRFDRLETTQRCIELRLGRVADRADEALAALEERRQRRHGVGHVVVDRRRQRNVVRYQATDVANQRQVNRLATGVLRGGGCELAIATLGQNAGRRKIRRDKCGLSGHAGRDKHRWVGEYVCWYVELLGQRFAAERAQNVKVVLL